MFVGNVCVCAGCVCERTCAHVCMCVCVSILVERGSHELGWDHSIHLTSRTLQFFLTFKISNRVSNFRTPYFAYYSHINLERLSFKWTLLGTASAVSFGGYNFKKPR